MKISRFVGALAALMLCAGCGITVDLSNLTFQPEDALMTPDDSVEPDAVVGKDRSRPEDAEPDENVVEPPAVTCWEALDCVLHDEDCNDLLTDSCVRNCAEDEDWKTNNPMLDKIQACVYKKCSGDPRYPLPDDYFMCFAEQCAQELVECIRLPEGEQSCGEVMACVASDGCFDDEGAPELDCLAGCFENINVNAMYEIEALFEECVPDASNPNGRGREDPECIETMFDCYGGNGEADCTDTLTCLGECSEEFDGRDDRVGKDSCEAACFMEMSEEASQAVSGMFACQVDEMANPFDCAIAAMPCLAMPPEDQVTCNSMAGGMSMIFAAYYFHRFPNYSLVQGLAAHLLNSAGLTPDDVGPLEQFSFMMWGVSSVFEEQQDDLEQVLECLSASQPEGNDIPPGENAYGQVKVLHWGKCVDGTVCQHSIN